MAPLSVAPLAEVSNQLAFAPIAHLQCLVDPSAEHMDGSVSSVCCHAVSRLSRPSQRHQLCQVCCCVLLPAYSYAYVHAVCMGSAPFLSNLLVQMQHQRQNKLQSKRVSKHIAAALASHQDVPASTSNGAGGGKPRVMVIGVTNKLNTMAVNM